MKIIKIIFIQYFILSFIFTITACNNANEPAKADDHFIKEKLDTIKKAEAVDQLIQDTAAKQLRNIDGQSE